MKMRINKTLKTVIEKLSGQWEKISSEPGPDLKLFRARFDFMKNPRNGKTERMIVLEGNDSANVIAITPQQEMLFVRQYRFGIEDYTVELPGGIVDNGEDHGAAARRELIEETGFSSSKWQYLGKVPSNPVFMDNWIHHWVALDVEETGDIKLDDGEEVELLRIPVSEVRRKMTEEFFLHPHTVHALVIFFAREGTW
jgi:ADP-ribose pyrophosphatase